MISCQPGSYRVCGLGIDGELLLLEVLQSGQHEKR